jgi:hypothetical protein
MKSPMALLKMCKMGQAISQMNSWLIRPVFIHEGNWGYRRWQNRNVKLKLCSSILPLPLNDAFDF